MSSGSPTTCAPHTFRDRVEADVESADISGVTGTPTFFVNGRRHRGAYDLEALSEAVRAAKARSFLADLRR